MMDQPYIICPKCGMVSHNPNDVRERYCGACHAFHDALMLPSHCFACGVHLMGGATVHKPGCAIRKLIEENIPRPAASRTEEL
jgi:hypothetical protein